MTRLSVTRGDRWVLFSLVLFTLAFRLATIMTVNTGVDERDYWESARALSHGLPYPELSHRTTRYGVILPVAAVQLVLGLHPNVYHVMPVLNCMIQAALVYLLGLRLRGRLTGFLAALAMVLFPYMIRAGSQVRPEIFSITYMLLSVFYFVEYLDRENERFKPLLWAALWMFVSYETKITNLFMVPGMLLAIILYKRRPRDVLVFAGILFGLYLVETALYATFTRFKYGELEIITQKHFHADSFTVPRVIDLLQRYAPENLQWYWSLPFAAFGLGSIFYLRKGRDIRIKGLLLASASFFFFITIAVKSLNPITPAESFINRYFSVVLVPVFLTLAYWIEGAVRRFMASGRSRMRVDSPRLFIVVLLTGLVVSLGIFSLPSFPERLRLYAHSPFDPGSHPFALNERYRRLVNEAYTGGTPIVAGNGLAGLSAISTAASFYLDLETFIDGRPPRPTEAEVEGETFWLISRTGLLGGGEPILVARRFPFNVEYMRLSDASATSGQAGADRDD
ncbi:MAG: hypothetical protein CVV47_04290 [Spirochaetae bacterium HGW-Spirochaetae-3]|jgi:hypothetical protein|nr:MAG: hypothetical protein CVV47_04290 [Spirochaetae bacterium HGW-Spirochaetae-3]